MVFPVLKQQYFTERLDEMFKNEEIWLFKIMYDIEWNIAQSLKETK